MNMALVPLPRQERSSPRNVGGWQCLSPRTLRLSIALMWVSLTIVTAQDLQCPDGQVVMEVSGNDPSIFGVWSKFEVSVTSPGYDEDYFEFYATYDDPLQFEAFCVPGDKCLVVNVETKWLDLQGIASDISIIYETMSYSLLGPFPTHGDKDEKHAFYAEVGGSCKITCEEGQVLLEIEAVTDPTRAGGTEASSDIVFTDDEPYLASAGLANQFDWQVMDDSTNEVIRACPPSARQSNNTTDSNAIDRNGCYWSMAGLFRDRVCVPKDGCFRLVAGQSTHDFRTIFQVTFGGELLLRTEFFLFDSLLLQPLESPSTCSIISPCQSETDSSHMEMEVFIFRNELHHEDGRNLTWNADYVVSGQVVTKNGTVLATDRPLQHNRICIPGCALFYVSAGGESGYTYRVQADGIIYAENTVERRSEDWFTASDVIGSSCEKSEACEVQGQSLVQVDVRYRQELEDNFNLRWWPSMPETWSIFAVPFRKSMKYKNDVESAPHMYTVTGFATTQPGNHYTKQMCLDDWYFQEGSKAKCTAVAMNRDVMETYSVSVDGEVFGESIDCSQKVPLAYRHMCSWARIHSHDFSSGSFALSVIPLNGNCKKRSIPGIVSSATVVGVLLVAGLCYCLNRRRLAASEKSKDLSAAPADDGHDTARNPDPASTMNEHVVVP